MTVLMLFSLTGCNYFTARVDSIGLREYKVDTTIAQVKYGEIIAEYYDITEEQWGHSIWSEKKNGAHLGSVELHVIEGLNCATGTSDIITRDNNGREIIIRDFSNAFFKDDFHGSGEFRIWYGYPAQALKLISIPLDVVFFWLL
jgi:hypothetical protein